MVAEEVRALAIRSADAAKQTAALIDEAVVNAKHGADLGSAAYKQLGSIDGEVHKVGNVMGEIASASSAQRTGVAQISEAVERINEVTQTVAANSEESAATAQELESMAAHMRSLIASFTITSVPHSAPPPVKTPSAHRREAPPARPVSRPPSVSKQPRSFTDADEAALLESF